MPRTALPLTGVGVLIAEGPLYNPPATPVPTTATTGGSVAAGTYLVVISFVTPLGETVGSGVGTVTTTGTTSTITVPSPAGAILGPASPNFAAYTGYNVYMTAAGGSTFTKQNATPQPIGTNFLLSTPPSSSGAAPFLTDPAGATIDQVNGMQINLTTETVPPGYDAMRSLMLRVKNTAASAFNLIVRAGVYPPAMRQFLGDQVVAIPAGNTYWVGPLDSARHAVQDTTVAPTALEVNIDFSAGAAGTITAFALPRNVPGNP